MYQTLTLPQSGKAKSWVREIVTILAASCLITLFAPIHLRLPFTPVPIIMQCHVVLFLGALLGSRRGALATLAFLAQVAMGLPFLSGWKGSLLTFAGPTGGYLIGWVVGAYLTGLIVEKLQKKTAAGTFGALLLGNLAIYCFGYLHLANYVGYQKALFMGILPFIVGDLFKTLLCMRSLKALRFFA